MSRLIWGVKDTFVDYVRGMSDGRIVLDGVRESPDGFVFPSRAGAPDDGIRRFSGSVTFAGHGGMMRVVIADPWLLVGETGGELSIADPDDASARLPFARIASFDADADADGTLRARGTTLTADGSDLFFGPYAQGTPFDDPVVTA